MKKRLLSLVLCLVMVFSLLPFGTFAAVYPVGENSTAVELQFYKGTECLNTQRVNNNGGSVPAGAIYDPGCPVDGEQNEYFIGWSINGGPAGTIDDVLEFVNTNYDDYSGGELKIDAVLSEVHYLVYYDETGDRVLKTVAVVKARNNNSWDTKVDLDYVPANADENAFGWATTPHATVANYQNDDTITLTDPTTPLYPVCKKGVWLLFDSNVDKNVEGYTSASFTEPQLYSKGDVPVKPTDPTREGYTFVNWYDNKNGEGSPYDFSQPINAETTLYAKWAPAAAQYTVVFWRQDPTDSVGMNDNDKHYSFDSSVVKTATTGTTVNLANSGVTLNPGTGFSVNDNKTQRGNVTVKADNSTTINVYYDRNAYTLTFSGEGYKYTVSTSTSNGYYYIPDGNGGYTEQYLYRNNGKWYTDRHFNWGWDYYESERYDGQVYSRSYVSDSKTINALYEHSIKDEFPIVGENGVNFNGYTWTDTDSSTYQYVLATIDTMPAANETFSGSSRGTQKTIYYYKEVIPGVEPSGEPRKFGDKTYELYKTVNHNFNFLTYDEEYHPLEGFSRDRTHADPVFGSHDGNNNEASIGNNNRNYLYYDRNSWKLEFYDGFDNTAIGGENQVAPVLKYEQPLENYGNLFTVSNGGQTITYNGVSVTHEGYLFVGWYADQSCTTPFDFTKTMPNHDVPVYAKWTQMRFRILVDPTDAGAGVTNVTLPSTQSTSFRVIYGDEVLPGGLNGATCPDYQLVGWYSDAARKHPFNFSFSDWITIADMTYASSENRQGVDVVTGEQWSDVGEQYKDVVGKVTIYAKWRHTMNPDEYIKVSYDANGGTGAPTDDLHYADQAEAIAQPASVSGVDGESFSCWEVMKKTSDTDNTLIPSGIEVRPGEIFNVKLGDAVSNGNEKIVTLRAKYVSTATTHITWVGNGGVTADNKTAVNSEEAYMNAEVDIMDWNTFEQDGYVFLGWARLDEAQMWDAENKQWRDPADVEGVGALGEDDLWLKWDADNNKWLLQTDELGEVGAEAKHISANNDPNKPLHVLYAVWEKTTPATYLIDFGAQMMLAENGSIKKGSDTHKNGKFSVVNNAAVYQLKADQKISDAKTEVVDLTMSGVDSATIHGNFYYKDKTTGEMATEAKAAWKDVTVVPASSVYFDDSFTTPITVGDGSGFNSELDGKNVNSTADPAQGRMTFTFYGTRADFYCTTTATGQTVRAYITDSTGAVKKTVSMKNQSTEARYNVPTVSFDMGTPDNYTVTFVDIYGDYKIDGVRIYNSVAELAGTEEADAHYIKLHDKLVDGIDAMLKEQGKVEGIAFHMDNGSNDLADYAKEGPKNEIYLDENEYVAFEIENFDAYTGTPKVMVGLSVQHDAQGLVQLNGNDSQYVKSVIDEYYVVDVAKTGDSAGIVFIKNLGSERIAVTNLKITGVTGVTGVTVDYNSTSEYATTLSVAEEPAAEVEAFEPKLVVTNRLLSFVQNPVFPEAETGAQEDPTPIFQDVIRQLLSSFVNALFSSISRLFGN